MKKHSVFIVLFTSLLLNFNAYGQVSVEGISLGGILDSKSPEVELTYPNGAEIFQIGDSVDITWNAVDSSFGDNPISLFYSSDSGNTFTTITSEIANSGVYRWEIPDTPSLNTLIKISAADSFGFSNFDTSDAVYKIDGPPDPPANLIASLEDHTVNLEWDAVDIPDVAYYFIYRSTSLGFDTSNVNRIDTVYSPTTNYADTNIVHNTTYFYIVTAVDSMFNQSIASEIVAATPYILNITSVNFSQRTDGSGSVDINYSFTGNSLETYTISPSFSIDDGASWTLCNANNVEGDFGEGILPGVGIITWDFISALPETYTSNARIKIEAAEEGAFKGNN